MVWPGAQATLLCIALFFTAASSEAAGSSNYTEVFYPSGELRIQSYLYKPSGAGPFAAVIYNHGSRRGSERRSVPEPHIGKFLTGAGYAALVIERRGYGRSDGPTFPEAFNYDKKNLVPRLQLEADDAIAAAEYLRSLSYVDAKRIGIMGWSFGGIVTMFASSRSGVFAAAVSQAGGALTWKGNPDVAKALIAAAQKTTTPTLLMIAANDRTTEPVTVLDEILSRRGVPHRAIVYPPFDSKRNPRDVPAGHRIFSAEGMEIWEKDTRDFFARYLTVNRAEPAVGQ
jgi:dienelactone hydrolase